MRQRESSITNKFVKILKKFNLNSETIEVVKKEMEDREMEILQDKMSSIYRINKAINEKFDSVHPIELVFNAELKAYYVPIKDNLQSILKHPSIFPKIIANLNEKNDSLQIIIRSYKDGSHYSNCEFRKKKENAVDLMLYVDEFELCDSLSKHKKSQKMFAIYFTIGKS